MPFESSNTLPAEHIIFDRLYDDTVMPERATPGSAGLDLRAYLIKRAVKQSNGVSQSEEHATEHEGVWGIALAPGSTALIPLGFRARLPLTVEGQIRPRSGQAFKNALTVPNAPGTIDSDYAEEWMVMVRNDAPVTRRIEHGERIAQVVFARYLTLPLVIGDVERTTNRAGGFGSTGHE